MSNNTYNISFSSKRSKYIDKREKKAQEKAEQERIEKLNKEKLDKEKQKEKISNLDKDLDKDKNDTQNKESKIVKKKKVLVKKKIVKKNANIDTSINTPSKNSQEIKEKTNDLNKDISKFENNVKNQGNKAESDKIKNNEEIPKNVNNTKYGSKRFCHPINQSSKLVNQPDNASINSNKNNLNNKNMGITTGKNEKVEKEDLKKEVQRLKLENNELKKIIEKQTNKEKEEKTYNPSIKYDIALKIDTLKDLLQGWKIKYNDDTQNKYLSLINEKILTIGLLGMKNTGKSFFISKILNEKVYDKKETNYLCLRYIIKQKADFKLAIIDPPGLGRSIKSIEVFDNIIKNDLNKQVDESEKNIIQTDNFLINFLIKKCNFLIVVVGNLNIHEQKLLMRLKSKDEEHKEAFKELKRIFVIHNLKDMSKKEEIQDHIKNILLNSLTFNLLKKETQLTQKKIDKTKNSKYFIEKNDNKEIIIYHLILAKDNTDAGKYYNDFTYNLINQQFNYFHENNTFDLINEIKKEIINISSNIFIKPLKTLDDFENSKDKIKVKKEFEYISNQEENSDFSFIQLKPKYSYYKIEKNTKLLVTIEIPGKIINQKLVCSAPKNGYYSMKFSGKKLLEFPENFENEKKNGLFFNNREEGEFKEVFKIKQEDFSLSSYNYIKEENDNNGVYKYYFQLMGGNSSDDED